jgi:hypothetical protein
MSPIKPLATVEVLQNNTLVGTAQTQANGSWSFSPPALAKGTYTFSARLNGTVSNSWTIQVDTDQMNLTAPHFRNATNAGGGREEINYYAHEGDGFVEIPNYGMKAGDTVRVSWVGRRVTYNSEIQTVANPLVPLVFKISMYDVIDCIGVNAAITYTVVRPPSVDPQRSATLNLSVMGHVGAIAAPTINSPDNNNIRVQFVDDYYSAQVRFIGLTTVESPVREFHGNYLNFTIDANWRAANRGKPVLFNYSLKRFGNDSIFYSQILRVENL